MPATRTRRIVRRAVLALAVVALLAGLAGVWPSDVKRSRALRLGMTRAEVAAVMGRHDGQWGVGQPPPDGIGGGGSSGITNGSYFGKSIVLQRRVFGWMGVTQTVRHEDWPVRVRFDDNGHLDYVKRDGERAEEALPATLPWVGTGLNGTEN